MIKRIFVAIRSTVLYAVKARGESEPRGGLYPLEHISRWSGSEENVPRKKVATDLLRGTH